MRGLAGVNRAIAPRLEPATKSRNARINAANVVIISSRDSVLRLIQMIAAQTTSANREVGNAETYQTVRARSAHLCVDGPLTASRPAKLLHTQARLKHAYVQDCIERGRHTGDRNKQTQPPPSRATPACAPPNAAASNMYNMLLFLR